MYIYSVYDRVKKEFSEPFYAKNRGVAARMLATDRLKMPEHVKLDFDLYELGEFDPLTGQITTLADPGQITGFDAVTGKFPDLTEVI